MIRRTRTILASGFLAAAVSIPTVALGASSASAAPMPTAAKATTASSAATAKRQPKSSRAAAMRRTVVARGSALKGTPYRYGGTTPSGFDCSGFTQYTYKKAGKSIPRTASAQRRATTRISRSAAVPGDLVFFHRNGRVYHVGLYAGGNKVLHSPRTGSHVKIESIWTSNVSFGRVSA